jgi:hypothetical protein
MNVEQTSEATTLANIAVGDLFYIYLKKERSLAMKVGDGYMFFFSRFGDTEPFEITVAANFLSWVCVPLRDATIIIDHEAFEVTLANQAKAGRLIATDKQILVLKRKNTKAYVNLSDGTTKANIASDDALCFTEWQIATPRKKKSERRRAIIFSTKPDTSVAPS